ncbi:MAG: adenylate kinase [Acidobacteria bacterium]|nr:MAG: adenylate kinase [Acidobacteriota bacterium]
MAKTKVITLLGAPGAGKGTQAKILADKFGYKHVSTGEVLRDAVRQGKPLGQKVKAVMEAGELVSDDLVSEIVRERVTAPDAPRVFILDGYPRNVPQATYLDNLGNYIDVYVVDIKLEEEQAVKRLSGRRYCSACGKIYNVFFSPSVKDGICDVCGSQLLQRKDDAEEVIKERFRVYRQQTAPVTDFYSGRPNFFEVDGNREPDEIASEMSCLVNSLESQWSTAEGV